MTWQVPLNYMYVCKLLVHLIWKLYSFMNDIVNFRKWCVTGSTLTCTARSWCTYWLRRRRGGPISGDCARNYRKVLKPGQYTVQWTEFTLYSIFAKYKKKLEFKLKMTYHLTGIRLNESCKKWFRILNHKQNYGLGILMGREVYDYVVWLSGRWMWPPLPWPSVGRQLTPAPVRHSPPCFPRMHSIQQTSP